MSALLWTIGWSIYGYDASQSLEYATEQLTNLEKGDAATYLRTADYYIDEAAESRAKIKLAEQVGIGVPLGLLILWPFAYFIYRGFKPKGAE
ncbi:hypothetical protein K3165_03735 [Qipengyuania sp. 1XM1-15A]|uniref:hypothetical protein n=1 Tax=Qipengyuania xiamenensis TaxID=2867237 RepID=UPI001C869AE2|nr:hypothetical protein [Qipengyuania xiamenensis]MBX7532033.1 hypothetical protein [Qipengyuania xiamenensis]